MFVYTSSIRFEGFRNSIVSLVGYHPRLSERDGQTSGSSQHSEVYTWSPELRRAKSHMCPPKIKNWGNTNWPYEPNYRDREGLLAFLTSWQPWSSLCCLFLPNIFQFCGLWDEIGLSFVLVFSLASAGTKTFSLGCQHVLSCSQIKYNLETFGRHETYYVVSFLDNDLSIRNHYSLLIRVFPPKLLKLFCTGWLYVQ